MQVPLKGRGLPRRLFLCLTRCSRLTPCLLLVSLDGDIFITEKPPVQLSLDAPGDDTDHVLLVGQSSPPASPEPSHSITQAAPGLPRPCPVCFRRHRTGELCGVCMGLLTALLPSGPVCATDSVVFLFTTALYSIDWGPHLVPRLANSGVFGSPRPVLTWLGHCCGDLIFCHLFNHRLGSRAAVLDRRLRPLPCFPLVRSVVFDRLPLGGAAIHGSQRVWPAQ